MKRHGTTVILLIVLIAGLSLLLYPSFSDWWNSMHQSRAIASYVEQVAGIDEEQYAHLWEDAWNYNESLAERPNHYVLDDEQKAQYNQILDISGLPQKSAINLFPPKRFPKVLRNIALPKGCFPLRRFR